MINLLSFLGGLFFCLGFLLGVTGEKPLGWSVVVFGFYIFSITMSIKAWEDENKDKLVRIGALLWLVWIISFVPDVLAAR